MKLTFNDIKSISFGAARAEERDGRIWFYRFTEAQMAAYKDYSADFYGKCRACAGIKLEFYTDSRFMSIAGDIIRSSNRDFYGIDVCVDGALLTHKGDYFSDDSIEYAFEMKLGGNNQKRVTVYFPWSVQANIALLTLDDGSSFEPVKRKYKMINFGDSITQGYIAQNPSFTYASRLSDLLDADSVNKGIGGEIFFPTLAELRDDIEPDIITVAYGTNDWSHGVSKDKFEENSKFFYEALSRNYPNAKIFALAPTWRGNYQFEGKPMGDFFNVSNRLREIAETLPNVTFINCFDFIPHEAAYFVADLLHPNDAGFNVYASELYSEIKKYL